MRATIYTMLAVLLLAAAASATPMDDPFGYFNVYSLGDIGTSSSPYHSDFQGVAGAAGDVHFSGFSLHGSDSDTGYVLHTGGSAKLSGSYLGSVESGGKVQLGGVNVNGDVVSGENITNFSGGSMTGNAIAAKNVSLSKNFTVGGHKLSNVPYSPIADHTAVSSYFTNTSNAIAGMADTGTVTDQWGLLTFNGQSGVNVVSVSSNALKNAWGFAINAPEDAIVYINVDDSDVALDYTGWTYTGGVTAGDVLLNMAYADNLNLSSSNNVNILAPNADTTFGSGLLTGSLIVGDLEGGGQVNLGHFDHGGAVPEPMTLLTLSLGGMLVLRRRRKRQ